MFREMRRKRQLLDENACVELLKTGSCGVLAVNGENGYPYAVPLNYIYEDGKIYFHCAKSGHKLDAIAECNKVSFCVIGSAQNVPEKFTTYFRSVIVFGRAVVVEDETEKRAAIVHIADTFSPSEPMQHRDAEIAGEWKALCVVRIDIEHMTGKQAIELVKKQ